MIGRKVYVAADYTYNDQVQINNFKSCHRPYNFLIQFVQAAPVKTHQKKPDKLGNFLKFDRQVLRFFGYWDDTDSPYGYVHDLEILYYLADDTIEVLENLPSTCGPSTKSILVKKLKIPKVILPSSPSILTQLYVNVGV